MHAVLSSLRAFILSAWRPRTALARGIRVVLCVKLCVVVLMRLFLFGTDDRPMVDQSAMDTRLSPAVLSDTGTSSHDRP